MSANDKFGLGYEDHRYDSILSYENEVLQSVFLNKESELEKQPLYDRTYEADNEDEHVPQTTNEPGFKLVFASANKASKNPRNLLSHLIRDCDFHEKRMAKQAELNNSMRMKSSQREIRPIWNNLFTARASGTNKVSTARHDLNRQAVLTNAAMKVNTVKPIVNRVNTAEVNAVSAVGGKRETADYPHRALKHKGIIDSGCSRHMTGNKAYLAAYQDFNGGPVAFERTVKVHNWSRGKIKTGKIDFEDVCFVKELQHFNLFSVLHMCDKKNKVLFTDTECLVFNLENIVPSGGLACLIAKATVNESNKWHRRLGHVNFKNLNKLVKGNLVRGLPSKIFQNDHTCVACQKGKQHKASCKAKIVSSISQPLQLLHMDLFGPTSVRSINHKTYCLVITDDFSRFSWVFFLRTKDETSGILKDFIRQIENQLNQKVKTIRCDNGTEFKNMDIIEFYGSKGIKREYSNARTSQQNRVAERKNKTLIEAARTMLADSFLPNTFWAEAVSTACYVLNRALVTKPQNKTPYELITGKIPIISYIRPFGCHVTILNTIFEGKSDEGFLVGYSLNSKAFRPVRSENQANKTTGPEEANHSEEDQAFLEELERLKRQENEANDAVEALRKEFSQEAEDLLLQAGASRATSTNTVNTVRTPVSTASSSSGPSFPDLTYYVDQDDSQIPALEDIYDNPNDGIFTNASYDDEGTVANFTNLETTVNVSLIPASRIHSIHPTTQILGDPKSAVQTRSKVCLGVCIGYL
ncbi:putative ribonuclease H-like domain-containing protein [Tanacetum coccineum]